MWLVNRNLCLIFLFVFFVVYLTEPPVYTILVSYKFLYNKKPYRVQTVTKNERGFL